MSLEKKKSLSVGLHNNQNTKITNMPEENVQRATQTASDKNIISDKEVLFECYGPHEIAVLVETATDKYNRNLITQGSVEFKFDHICNFTIKSENVNLGELERVNFDIEELFGEEENIIAYTSFDRFERIQSFSEQTDQKYFQVDLMKFLQS